MAAIAWVLALTLLAAGCTTSDPARPADAGRGRAADLAGCPPVGAGDVRGVAPDYLQGADLDMHPLSTAVCAAAWAPRLGDGLVPQGLAVSGRTAWVSGYDDGQPGSLWCHVLRLDLATGRTSGERARVVGSVGAGPEVACRHGGGLALDSHGLWLTESARLWLLDPRTLDTLRVWRLVPPVAGSFGLVDPRGRVGLGRYRPSRAHSGRAAIDWFESETLLEPGVEQIGPDLAVATHRAPQHAQGAVWTRLAGRTGTWFATSDTRCGVLVGPGGTRLAFVPGAEGLAAIGGGLWVVSESAALPYVRAGGRPVVPSLSRLDVRRSHRWPEPSCHP